MTDQSYSEEDIVEICQEAFGGYDFVVTNSEGEVIYEEGTN